MEFKLLERQVLGCFLKDNGLLSETTLHPEVFRLKEHQEIYRAMQKLAKERKAIDNVTLLAECYDTLKTKGGIGYVTTLKTDGDLNNFESYERTLLEKYKDRVVQEKLQNYLSSEERDIHTLLRELEKVSDTGRTEEEDVKEILGELLLEPYTENQQDMIGIPSGLKSLDMITGGFRKKTSVIVGARPSMGKTALMLKFMMSAAKNGDVPIVFSLEMNKRSLLRRIGAAEARVNSFIAQQTYKLSELQKKKWSDAIGKISNLDFEIFDNSMKTIQDIRADVRRTIKKYPGRNYIVFIDYLTKIQNYGKFPSDHAKITDISDRLKAMAKEYNLPVVTLAQLSRSVEQRQDKRPMASDLRESGSIEQDADLILLLYRESYYYEVDQDKENILEINVAKHRDGPLGNIEVYYNRSTGEIRDLE